jgi:hypothetical protein
MKKVLFLLVFVFLFVSCHDESVRQKAQRLARENETTAITATPIPKINYFQERRTIAKWAERWDTPSVPCYVYIISYGTIIGYYVSDGKPSSTQSYLFPEVAYYSNGAVLPTQDLDGTYGTNNPGIRFFTADGAAVEVGGNIGYIYSDVPLPINAPKFSK